MGHQLQGLSKPADSKCTRRRDGVQHSWIGSDLHSPSARGCSSCTRMYDVGAGPGKERSKQGLVTQRVLTGRTAPSIRLLASRPSITHWTNRPHDPCTPTCLSRRGGVSWSARRLLVTYLVAPSVRYHWLLLHTISTHVHAHLRHQTHSNSVLAYLYNAISYVNSLYAAE